MKTETKGEQQPAISVNWRWDGNLLPAWHRLADRLLGRRKAGTEATGDGGKKKDS